MKSNIEVVGTVANLRAGFFRVGNYLADAVLTARVASKMKGYSNKVRSGDQVRIDSDGCGQTKGRITYRHLLYERAPH
jgi:translation initiation factor IF-1